MAYNFFINCVEKAKLLKDSSKIGTIFAKKASTKMMTLSEQEKRLLFSIQLYCSKAILVLNVPAKFESDWIKDKEAIPI